MTNGNSEKPPDFSNLYSVQVDNESFGEESQLGDQVRYEIIDMLRSGWSPPKITRHLYHTLNLEIPPTHIVELRDALPPVALLPPGKLTERLQYVDLEIDALGDLGRLIKINEKRLDKLLELEGDNIQQFEATDELIKLMVRQLREYLELKMRLGLLPEEAPDRSIVVMSKEPTVEEILKNHGIRPDGSGSDSGASGS
jgi:hypothetical protein